MMRTCLLLIKCLPAALIVALFFISCGQSDKEIARLMERAETVLQQQPDSALHYLQAVENPGGLRKMRRMDYCLLLLQAKDKTGRDISADTAIVEVKNHFLQKKDFEKATLAAFYEGLVFAAGKDDQRAIQAFLEAESMAGHITDNKRKGLIQYNIGYLYYNSRTDYNHAAVRFKQAFGYFQAGHHYTYGIEALNLLGTCFLLQGQADSALFYQQQAMDIAVVNRDTTAWAKTLQNISVTYRQTSDNLNAKIYALQSIQLHAAAEQQISSILNLAHIYYDCAQYDSAAFYVNKILQIPEEEQNSHTMASVYVLLYKV